MKKFLPVLCLLFLTACPEDSSTSSAKISELEKNITLLETRITKQDELINTMQNDSIKRLIDIIDLQQKFQSTVFFTPASKGYSPIWTAAGNLLVSLDNIEKYANGYKLYFRIGNPTLATFANVQFKTEWNKVWSPEEGSYSDWEKRYKSTEITMPSNLLPGRWNSFVVVISPAKEEDTGTIKVTLGASLLSLANN